MKKEFVTFYSPGTFVSEYSQKPIETRDVRKAVEMAASISERYNAKPYAFDFTTRIVADPIPDGYGGTLNVEAKTIDTSGHYFLSGRLETVEDVERRRDHEDTILLSNMRGNGMWIVCVTNNGYRHVMAFKEQDFVVDHVGSIVHRGTDPQWVAYRARQDLLREQERILCQPRVRA